MQTESDAMSNKTRLNSDAELIDFEDLIILNLINNVSESYRNTNVSVSVLPMTSIRFFSSLVVKPRDIGG